MPRAATRKANRGRRGARVFGEDFTGRRNTDAAHKDDGPIGAGQHIAEGFDRLPIFIGQDRTRCRSRHRPCPRRGGSRRDRSVLTKRTFFRYFAQWCEVLFDGQPALLAALTAIVGAPENLWPLSTLFRVFRSTMPALAANRPDSEPRQWAISSIPGLHASELAKTAALAEALKARSVTALRKCGPFSPLRSAWRHM